MTRQQKSSPDVGKWLYLQRVNPQTGEPVDRYNRRGQVGEGDDVASFTRLMERSGLRVIILDENRGDVINGKEEPV